MANTGRPEKYTTHVQPYLEEIKTWREQGMKLEAIARELNISYDTFWRYKNQFPELSEMLSTARPKLHEAMLVKAEDSIMTVMKDREVTEVTVEEYVDDEGKVTGSKLTKRTRILPASTPAIMFALKNRDSDNWKDTQEVSGQIGHTIIPQPLAPVRDQDALEGEIVESEDEAD